MVTSGPYRFNQPLSSSEVACFTLSTLISFNSHFIVSFLLEQHHHREIPVFSHSQQQQRQRSHHQHHHHHHTIRWDGDAQRASRASRRRARRRAGRLTSRDGTLYALLLPPPDNALIANVRPIVRALAAGERALRERVCAAAWAFLRAVWAGFAGAGSWRGEEEGDLLQQTLQDVERQ